MEFIRSKIGGSGVTGGTLNIEVSMLMILKGGALFRDLSTQQTCSGGAAGSAPCKLMLTNVEKEVCLDCLVSGTSANWIIDDSGQLLCDSTTATGSYAPRTTSFYHPTSVFYKCGYKERVSSGSCSSCHTLCGSCNGGGNSDCLSCDFTSKKFISGAVPGKCTSSCKTTNKEFKKFNSCSDCESGCSQCSEGHCSDQVCSGTEVFNGYECCDINSNKFIDGSSCSDCDSACSTCHGGNSDECLTCPSGKALNVMTGSCINCDTSNKKYVDVSDGSCKTCPTGCTSCLSATHCTGCDVGANYHLAQNTCLLCDTNNGKFVNEGNSPPTCDNCGSNCKVCSDASTCQTCDSGYNEQSGSCVAAPSCEANCLTCTSATTCTGCNVAGGYFLSSGDCLSCAITNKKFIPVAGTSCQSCSDSNCLVCPNGSPCMKCDTSSGFYLNGGSCQSCQITNKKFIPAAGTSCQSCSDSKCLVCPNGSPCTKCDTSSGFYLNGGSCQSCDINNGKFIPSSGDSCLNCEANCLKCSDGNTCTECDGSGGYFLSSGDCSLCSEIPGRWLDSGSNTCSECVSNCQTCSSTNTCQVCKNNYYRDPSGTTCSFCDPNGFFIDRTGSSPTCTSCGNGCLSCSSSTSCSVCDTSNNYHKVSSGECVQCDLSENSPKFLNTQGGVTTCETCSQNCRTCSCSADNCTSCPPNFILTISRATKKTCEIKKSNCHESCSTCSGPKESDCLSCKRGSCRNVDSSCSLCPEENKQTTDSVMTWVSRAQSADNTLSYRIDFSEHPVVFEDKFDLNNLSHEIKVTNKNAKKFN